MVHVLHTGDTHIGYRQYHSRERLEDFLEAFEMVVEDAIEDDVDAVIHAGDLFNDRRPGLQDILGTIGVLEHLRAADIPFLAVVGNHEDTRRGQWLDLFSRLGLATRLDDEGTMIDDTVFYGLDYVPKSRRDELEYRFEPREAEHAALVGHGLFSPFPHGDWDLSTVLERSNVEFDAVLLGDDHTPDVTRVAGTWATYCGSTERASATEREPRGYNLVEFDGDVSITRRGLDTRDFVFIDVELGPGEGEGLIRERIRESSVDDAVVVITVDGEGESIVPADIEAFGDERGALLTRVNDRREFEQASAEEVSFADPDEAVRERVRELGLSEAARSIDDAVRTKEIAHSNLRERVKDRIQELLDAPEAFDSLDDETVDPSEDATAESSDDEVAQSSDDEVAESPDEAVGESTDRETVEVSEGDKTSTETDDDTETSNVTTMEDFL